MCLVGSKDFLRPWTESTEFYYTTQCILHFKLIFFDKFFGKMTVCIVPHSDPQVSTMHLHVLALHITSITTFTMKFWWENAYCWFAVFFNYRSLEHSTHTYLGNLPTRIKGKNSYDLSIHTYLYYLYLFFCYVQLFCDSTFWVCTFQLSFCWAKSQKRFDHEFWGPHSQKDLCLDKWYITVSSTCQFASNLLTRFF